MLRRITELGQLRTLLRAISGGEYSKCRVISAVMKKTPLCIETEVVTSSNDFAIVYLTIMHDDELPKR